MQHAITFSDIARIVSDQSAATEWARNHGLLVNPVGNNCTLTPGCTGRMYSATVRGRPNIRCPKCKRYRSAANAPAIFGGINGHASWLTIVDRHGRPQAK